MMYSQEFIDAVRNSLAIEGIAIGKMFRVLRGDTWGYYMITRCNKASAVVEFMDDWSDCGPDPVLGRKSTQKNETLEHLLSEFVGGLSDWLPEAFEESNVKWAKWDEEHK